MDVTIPGVLEFVEGGSCGALPELEPSTCGYVSQKSGVAAVASPAVATRELMRTVRSVIVLQNKQVPKTHN